MIKRLLVKLHRLSAMNIAEIFLRSYRSVREIIDRTLLTFQQPYIAKEKFIKKNHLGEFNNSSEMSLVDSFRLHKVFAWQEMSLLELRIFLSNHLKKNKRVTIATAERIINHEFDIIGKKIKMNPEIDWNYDILSQKSVPVHYWTEIDLWHPDTVCEIRYIWELNRHQHFVTLAKSYLITGREKFARALFSQWCDWLEKNPYKFGVNWSSALEVSIRLVSWTWALQMVKWSRYLTDNLYIDLLESIEKHALYIEQHLSFFSSANNHLLGEALGLFYAGVYYPQLARAAVWRKKGYKIFCRELLRQIHPDGVIKEQSAHYHLYDLYFGFLFILAARCQHAPLPKKVNKRLMKMAHFLFCLLNTNDMLPQIGDEDGGMALRLTETSSPLPYELLNAAAIQLRCGYLNAHSPGFTETAFWMCGFKGLKTHLNLFAPPLQSSLEQFSHGGYYIIRHTEKPRSHLIFDCGPLGLAPLAAHGHADALSFLLNIEDEPVLIDSGTFMYLGAQNKRDYFRGSSAHNTVCVDGSSTSEIGGPFQWRRKGRAQIIHISNDMRKIIIHGRQSGYRFHSPVHERLLQFEQPAQWSVTDRIIGKGLHSVKLYFHTGALDFRMLKNDQVQFRFKNFSVLFAPVLHEARREDGVNYRIFVQVDSMTHSPHFGVCKEHPTLIISIDGVVPMQVTTKISMIT